MMKINGRALIRYTAVTGTDTDTDFMKEKESKNQTKIKYNSTNIKIFRYEQDLICGSNK
jgi:hypothetical protein